MEELGFLLPLLGMGLTWGWLALPREPQLAAWWYWFAGWFLQLLAGGIATLGRDVVSYEWTVISSAMFGCVMLAGVLRIVGRRVPAWLLPLGLLVGLLRAGFYAGGPAEAASLVSLGLEPLFFVAACVVAHRGALTGIGGRLLAPSCLLLAIVEAADAVIDLSAGEVAVQWSLWFSAAAITLPVQILVTVGSLRDHATRFADALQAREEHLRILLDSLHATRLVLMERSGRVDAFGMGAPSEGDALGSARLAGDDLLQQITSEDREAVRQAVHSVFDTGENRHIAFRLELPQGSRHWTSELAPVRRADGTIDAVLAVAQDVTEREETLEALRRSEARLSALLSSVSQNQVVILDREHRIESVVGATNDPRDLETRREVEGRTIDQFLGGERLERLREAIDRVFETGRNVVLREERIDLPTRPSYYDISLRPLRAGGGEVERVISVVVDVTARRQDEERRQQLEQRVAQSQKLESLGVLAGGIAHDFNNLLVGVMGNAELALRDTEPSDPRHACLRDIQRTGERATELTSQLLAYVGKAPVSNQTLRLPPLVEEMVGLLRSSIDPGVRLELDDSVGEGWVSGDATQLRQVVMSLVTNAAEALPGREGHVGVRLTREAGALDGGDALCLEVRDDGEGMDEATRERAFEPFFTTKFEGRGLGLAAVQGIVRAHGGSIHVDTEPDKGTTVRVLVPSVAAPATEPPAGGAERGTGSGSGCVLVVDDDEGVRLVAGRMLGRLGYEALLASGAGEARVHCANEAQPLAGILLDLTMPEIDGYRLSGELRRLRPDVRIVFMSGHSEVESAARVDGPFLKKPFRISDLERTLETVLG